MLTQEDPQGSRAARRVGPRPAWVTPVLVAAFLLVLVLRHDYWNWNTPYPLLFGFLPVGLWWQGLVSLLACGLMWLMVRLAWPDHLEDEAIEAEKQRLAVPPAAKPTGFPVDPK